jgi:D-alanyl-D-alanine carboxypeptidase
MRADLDAGVGAMVLVNAPDFDVTEEIGRDALAVLTAAVRGEALPEVPPPSDRLRVENAELYAGSYRGPDGDLLVQADGGHLSIEDGEIRAELEPLERDQFVPRQDRLDRYRVRFDRGGERIVGVTHGPRRWSTEPIRPGADTGAGYCGHYRSFNPWAPDIRVFERGDDLVLVTYPMGTEDRLVPVGADRFLVGAHPAPHRVRFDGVVDGQTLRATISGAPYYRTSL